MTGESFPDIHAKTRADSILIQSSGCTFCVGRCRPLPRQSDTRRHQAERTIGVSLDLVRSAYAMLINGLQLLLTALPNASRLLPGLLLPGDLASLIRQDVDVAKGFLIALFDGAIDPPQGVDLGAYVSALAGMDVGLAGLDLLARLLQDSSGGQDGLLRLLVKQEVLAVYVARCVADIDQLAGATEVDQELARRVRMVSHQLIYSLLRKLTRYIFSPLSSPFSRSTCLTAAPCVTARMLHWSSPALLYATRASRTPSACTHV